MSDSRISAALELWGLVLRLTSRRGTLSPRDKIELRDRAIRTIAALNGQDMQGASMRLDEEVARGIFVAVTCELAARGVRHDQFACWLEESWAEREQARSGAAR